jgi:CRP-like cAMP-binding protein
VRAGEPADQAYLVASGELAASKDGQPLTTLRSGDYFGEIALLQEQREPRP